MDGSLGICQIGLWKQMARGWESATHIRRKSMQIEQAMRRASRAWNISSFSLIICAVASAQSTQVPIADGYTGHPRMAIISDIGNEPDDQMSFVRLLLYSNEFDLETMIAS